MKKQILGLLAALLLVVGLVSAVSTTIDTTWNGGGSFATTFISGDDATAHFGTSGSLISGEFHAIDSNDDPYGYGVDSTSTTIKSSVGNGAMEYTFTRQDSYVPMYGVDGQQSYTYIQSLGLTATGNFAWSTSSNYAGLGNSNYGWQSNNQMMATGDHYIRHYLSADINNGAQIIVDAVGTTQVTDMCDSAGGTSFNFGKGCGCYTNANVAITGAGLFDLSSASDNQIVTDTGIIVNGGNYNVHSVFTGGFQFGNFALTGW